MDILITAQTKEESFDRLRTVLEILSQAGFSFNVTKCSFLKSSVEYLGFLITDGEIRPNPRNIRALCNLPPPQSVTKVRQFIGLALYFRQFVPKFSEIMVLRVKTKYSSGDQNMSKYVNRLSKH